MEGCTMGLKYSIMLIACLALGACAGFDEAVEISDEYAETPIAEYENTAGSWRIADKAGENRLKIGPSLARSFSAAFGGTVTFVEMPREEYQAAVEGWFASSGRACMVTDGQLLVSPQWEFRYSCR
jgi:hypothetical protein